MRINRTVCLLSFFFSFFALSFGGQVGATDKGQALDEKVRSFLARMDYNWHDMNISEADGELLYQIVIDHKYRRALEIGTSTGRSAIYIAWALSKTGGQLTTIEIDEERYGQAVANFKEAGLSEFIDARLADAHELAKELPGPFDFVFIDADKDWYKNYARAVIPKLEAGGCIAAHNVYEHRSGWRGNGGGTAEYYDYMKSLAEFETKVLSESRSGLAVSYKKK